MEPAKRYWISPDGHAILCIPCNRISYHPQDIKERYCGRCKTFHEGPSKVKEAA